MRKTTIILTSLALVLSAGLCYKHGRSIWVPIKLKVSGGRTTEQVMKTLGELALLRLIPDIERSKAEYPPKELTFIALKQEQQFEVWGKTWGGTHTLIKTYPFTGFSGSLGPKLKQGDRQIPEGEYPIDGLNPNSSYHLSIKVGYPSEEDQKIAKSEGRSHLGGDIFIHGKAVTIGCIPLGDTAIEEVFALVAKAGIKNSNLLVAPYDFRTKDLEKVEPVWLMERYQKLHKNLLKFNDDIHQ